jgi:hypothetical protein
VGKPEITFFSHRLDPTTRKSLLLRCGVIHVAHPPTKPRPCHWAGFFVSASPRTGGQPPIPHKKDWLASILGGLIDFGSLVASWTQQNADWLAASSSIAQKNDTHVASDRGQAFRLPVVNHAKCPIQPVGKPEITFFSHRLDPTTRESLLLRCGVIHVAHPSTKPRPCHWAGFFVGVAVLSKDGKPGPARQPGH